MAVIPGVTVDWQLSPRVITIPSTETEINIEDLQDTLLDLEYNDEGMIHPHLRNTSGGESLDGGVTVGWTMELQNAVIAPAPRTISLSQGNATSSNSDGLILTDDSATFISDGIEAGASIVNFTDGSATSVISVDSETQLTHYPLKDGVDNDWDISDTYKVWNEVQFSIGGGNLVSVDTDGEAISAIRSTFGNEILKTSASSSTVQELSAIQYSSYNGGVTINPISGLDGTEYPVGTQETPVRTLVDAVTIAYQRGFRRLFIRESMDLIDPVNIEGFIVEGVSHTATRVTLSADLLTHDTTFKNLNITEGTLDGDSEIDHCMIGDLTFFNGHIHYCGLYGTIELGGTKDAVIADCSTVDQDNPPTIDMGNIGNSLSVPNYSGILRVTNLSDASSEIGIGMNAGMVALDSSVSAGTAIVAGIGLLDDQSTGTAMVNSDGLINKANIALTVQEEIGAEIQYSSFQGAVTIDTVNGTAGTAYPIGTAESPSSNLSDAHAVAESRGFKKFVFASDYTFTSDIDYDDGYEFEGHGLQKTTLTFDNGCQLLGSEISHARCTGTVSGVVGWSSCYLTDLTYSNVVASSANILVHECLLHGVNTFADNFTGEAVLTDCWALPDAGAPPTCDMNDADFDLQIRNLSGFIKIQNCTQNNDVRVFLNSGGVELDSTVTDGRFLLTGVGSLNDNSASTAHVNDKDLLQASKVTNIKHAVESLRPHHTGTGTMYFWDPENGNDANDGTVESLAKQSFSAVYALAEDGNHDVITCISSISGQTVVDEQITLNKNYTFLRGPGRDFKIRSSHATTPAITITGQGVEVSSIVVDTDSAGTASAICITNGADFSFIDSVWSGESGGEAVCYSGSSKYSRILNCFFSHAGGDGIQIDGDVRHTKIEGTEVDAPNGDGIVFKGTTARNNIVGDGVKIYNSGGYGINIHNPALRNFIDVDADIYDNASGEINDNGVETRYGKANIAELNWTEIYLDATNGVAGLVYPRGTSELPCNNLTEAKQIAAIRGVDRIFIIGDYTFQATDNIDGYSMYGEAASISDIVLTDGVSCEGTRFYDMSISGSVLIGHNEFHNCHISGLANVGDDHDTTSFYSCILEQGTIELNSSATKKVQFIDCYSGVPGSSTPVLDFNSAPCEVAFRNYSGGIKIDNATEGQSCSFDFVSGQIQFDSSVTDINAVVRGNVKITDNSTGGNIDFTSVLIPESAFDGASVTLRAADGVAGTQFPIGTPTRPVSNIADAHTIATNHNLHGYIFEGTIIQDAPYTAWKFEGSTAIQHDIFVMVGAPMSNCFFRRVTLTGAQNGTNVDIEDGILSNVTDYDGIVYGGALDGTIAVRENGAITAKNVAAGSPVVIDLSNNGSAALVLSDSGQFTYTNADATNFIQVTSSNGTVILDSSCTGGTAVVSGSCKLVNNSTMTVVDETYAPYIVDQVWDEPAADHLLADTVGFLQSQTGSDVELSPELQLKIEEIYQLMGLDVTIPLVVNKTRRTAGTIDQTIVGDEDEVTVTRQP